MTLSLDAATFIATVREIVAERGEDFVYAQMDRNGTPGLGCSYVTSANVPPVRCLIGEVAYRHGEPERVLRDVWDGVGGVDDLCDRGYVHVTEDVQSMMLHSQAAQDTGARYGDILAALTYQGEPA